MNTHRWRRIAHFYPLAAFLGGFAWDVLTIGQRIRPLDFWLLGGYLVGAALLILWLAHRAARAEVPPADPAAGWRGRLAELLDKAPYLLVQFFFGGVFSALFILCFKSSAYLNTWLMSAALGGLLVANEFIGVRYGRRFTLTWALFALNAILLCNFALPHLMGSVDPLWFHLSTALGAGLTLGLRRLAPGRPGRVWPVWGIAGALLLAWNLGMIAPVPLVKRDLAVGHAFTRENGDYLLQVERAPAWQFWRRDAATVHVEGGGRLYGVSGVFAPFGIVADLEHRWEVEENGGWRLVYRNRFTSTGGREHGFRAYSWVLDPLPGNWRFSVATQDGRTIGVLHFRVAAGAPDPDRLRERRF